MFILKPLKNRPIAWLWGGQLFSSVGNEIHQVALIWIAAGLIGFNAGYLGALQYLMLFIFSLTGGVWADRWNPLRTLFWVDIGRGVVVLAIPAMALFGVSLLWPLIFVAIVHPSMGAFFDPALKTVIPQLLPSHKKKELQATNALMASTDRTARIIGPGLIGLFSHWVPFFYFFALDAVTFFGSAASIKKVHAHLPQKIEVEADGLSRVRDRLLAGWRMIKRDKLCKFWFVTGGISAAFWNMAMQLGYGLTIHQRFPENAGIYGFVISGYGVGNLLSNVIFGSIRIANPSRWMNWGRVLAALGFLLFPIYPRVEWMMFCAGFSALGGPITDLAFISHLQSLFKPTELSKPFRLFSTNACFCLLVGLVFSPTLLRWLKPEGLMRLSAFGLLALSAVGALIRFEQNNPRARLKSLK